MPEDNSEGRLFSVETEFKSFFYDLVEHQKSEFRKTWKDFPNQVLWVIKDGRIYLAPIDVTYAGAIIKNRYTEFPANIYGRPVRPDLVIRYVLAGCNPQAYVVTYQGWTRKGKASGGGTPLEIIADLPPDERLEILVFIGRSLDGQSYSKFFEIKREIHGDDNSKLLDLVERKSWRAANANDLQPMQ